MAEDNDNDAPVSFVTRAVNSASIISIRQRSSIVWLKIKMNYLERDAELRY